MEKIKVIYFGTPKIALSSFEALIFDSAFELLGLVTQTPKPQGRGNKIVESELSLCAKKNNIEVFETERISKDSSLISKLKEIKPDFFVTFAFGQILPQSVLDIPKFGTVNIHPSLLPKYRGANPIRAALLSGDKKTGITTALTVLALDEGDILLQEEIPLNSEMSYPELVDIIELKAPNILKKTLLGMYQNKIKRTPQGYPATYTKKTLKEDKILDFNMEAGIVHNKIRALLGDFTCMTKYKGKILKVLKSKEVNCEGNESPGQILSVTKDGILTKCAKNGIIIEEVKPEGKNNMSAYSWSLGSKIKIGDSFEA